MHSLGPRRTLTIVALGAVIALCASGLANAQTPAAFGIATTRNVPIRMSDGTVLRANLYRPTDLKTGKLAPGPFPVILSQTPYGKVDNEAPGGRLNQLTGYDPTFVQRGYIAAVVDVRGTGASGGQLQLLGPQEARDTVQVVHWASRLEHATGKVGTFGPSYLGINQFMGAALLGRNSPLKAMFPIIAANDPYRDLAVSGGLLNIESLTGLAAVYVALNGAGPAIGNTTDPLQALLDTAEHTATVTSFVLPDFADLMLGGPRAFDGEYWRSRSPDTVLKKIVANKIPVYLVGGLYDVFQSGEPLNFAGLQNAWAKRRPSAPMSARQKVTGRYQLMMGPWYHTTVVQSAFQATALAWFDHWLKGFKNGIADTKKPLHLIDPDGKRRDAARYPLERSQPTTYYLGAKSLTATPPAAGGADQISYSPISQPCNRATEQWALGAPALVLGLLGATDACAESNLVPAEFSPALTYTSPPLSEAKLIGGPITATIYATANTADTAWVVSLNDVAPDGSSRQLTAGGLLGSLRALDAVRSWKTTGGRTLFAYHPLTEASQQAVVPGKLTRYDVEIRPTFIRIPAGHRLRLDIATGDSPHIVPNLVQLPKLLGGSYKIERSTSAPSSLQLLLAPAARFDRGAK